jgi:hypothetical protein
MASFSCQEFRRWDAAGRWRNSRPKGRAGACENRLFATKKGMILLGFIILKYILPFTPLEVEHAA